MRFLKYGIMLFLIISYPQFVSANNFTFKFVANQSSIDGELNTTVSINNANIAIGAGGVYNKDEYKYSYARALVGNEIFGDWLYVNLGMTGLWGEAEISYQDNDFVAIGFLMSAKCDIQKLYSETVPITFTSSFGFAPEPLCFDDCSEFVEFVADVDWKVLKMAALVVSYRYVEVAFETPNKWQKADNAGYVGLKFFF